MAVFPQTFGAEYSHRMAAKLGMATFDGDFTTALLALMKRDKVDFTNLFRALSGVATEGAGEDGTEAELLRPLEGVLPEGSVKGDWAQWMRIYIVKVGKRPESCVGRLERLDTEVVWLTELRQLPGCMRRSQAHLLRGQNPA